jgi:hypothetical protein
MLLKPRQRRSKGRVSQILANYREHVAARPADVEEEQLLARVDPVRWPSVGPMVLTPTPNAQLVGPGGPVQRSFEQRSDRVLNSYGSLDGCRGWQRAESPTDGDVK